MCEILIKGDGGMLEPMTALLQKMLNYQDVQSFSAFQGLVALVGNELLSHYIFYTPNPKNLDHSNRGLELYPEAQIISEAIPGNWGKSIFSMLKEGLENPEPEVQSFIHIFKQHSIIVAQSQDWMIPFSSMIKEEYQQTGRGNGKSFSTTYHLLSNTNDQKSVLNELENLLIKRMNHWDAGIRRVEFLSDSIRIHSLDNTNNTDFFPSKEGIKNLLVKRSALFKNRIYDIPILAENPKDLSTYLYLDNERYHVLFEEDPEINRNPRKRSRSIIKEVKLLSDENIHYFVKLTKNGYKENTIMYWLACKLSPYLHDSIYQFIKITDTL